jgi:hypothetical protein
MMFDPTTMTVGQAALEVARVICEQLGVTALAQVRSEIDRRVRAHGQSDDTEALVRAVTLVLIKATDTRTGPKDRHDARLAGACLLWLAETSVRDTSLLDLYNRMLPRYQRWARPPC